MNIELLVYQLTKVLLNERKHKQRLKQKLQI